MKVYHINCYLLLFLLLFSNNVVHSEVYPDFFAENDAPFLDEEDNTKNFIYDAGYFANGNSKIYSKKYNFDYNSSKFYYFIIHGIEPHSCQEGIVMTFKDYFIKYSDSSRLENLSELNSLYSKNISCSSNTEFESPIQYIDAVYVLYYKFPIVITDSNISIFLRSIKDNDIVGSIVMCNSLNLEPNKPHFIQIKFTTKQYAISTQCHVDGKPVGDIETLNSNNPNEETLKIVISGSQFYLSNYIITVNIQSSEFYTKTGKAICNNDCLNGYYCTSNKCLKCPEDSYTCTSSTSKERCTILSDMESISGDRICSYDYVDLTNYEDISVEKLGPPYNNRVTLGFWTFISNYENSNIFHIVVDNFLAISITTDGQQPIVYCTVFERYYKKIKYQASHLDFQSYINQIRSEDIVVNKLNQLSVKKGQWFFSQCAMSFDHMSFYLNNIVNNIHYDNNLKKPLRKEILYLGSNNTPVVTEAFYYRSVYKKSDFQKFYITNMRNIKAKVYLRNLAIFQEYMDPSIHWMYHDISKMHNNSFPEIIFTLPFSGLQKPDESISTLTGKTTRDGQFIDVTINLVKSSSSSSLSPPTNFKKLPLLTPNYYFTDLDLNTEKISNGASNANYWDQSSSIIRCNEGNCLYSTCESITNDKNTVYPGISETSGYCDYDCPFKECPGKNGGKVCESSSNYFSYHHCKSKTEDYPMYFSSNYNCGNIVIDLKKIQPILTSYIIEIWIYFDFTYNSKRFTSTAEKMFLFHSNSFQLYKTNSDKFIISTPYSQHEINSYISQYEWNKYAFSVKYEKKENLYTYLVMINNSGSTIKLITTSNKNSNLDTISFCNGNCGSNSLIWGSAYYKNLRVWNGDKSDLFSIMNYEDYFTGVENRIEGIVNDFPLTSYYFKDNIVKDTTGNFENGINANDINNIDGWYLQLWNFAQKFDYIAAREKFGNRVTSVTGNYNQNIEIEGCLPECRRCWTPTTCYECRDKLNEKNYFLHQDKCKESTGFYFRTPSVEPNTGDLILANTLALDSDMGVTIAFWIKLFGFVKGFEKKPIIKFTYKDNNDVNGLYIYFDSSTNDNTRGLTLRLSEDNEENKIIAQEPKFRDNFGKWSFISIAFYDNNNNFKYFPKMMKFEINYNSYEIKKNLNENKEKNISINTFTINGGCFAIFKELKFYTTYIVGSFYFEYSSFNDIDFDGPSLMYTFFTGGKEKSDCYKAGNFKVGNENENTVVNDNTYSCVPDYDPKFKDNTTPNKYLDDLGNVKPCNSLCRNICYGGSEQQCSCLVSNANSQMFIRNNNINYCKKFDYINFASANKQTIGNITTATDTSKFTMHFWMFAYNYISDQFGGISFEWTNHLKIEVKKTNELKDNKYQFYCYLLNGNNNKKENIEIEINQWNFLNCAADLKATSSVKRLGMSIMNVESKEISKVIDAQDIIAYTNQGENSNLIIENTNDYVDWGVLFYKEIRLWTDYYQYSDFLGRIKIETPSLFPNLAHAWNPIYTNDQTVIDITERTNPFKVEGNLKVKLNVVNESVYDTDPFLCNENGQYYDKMSQKCLQFADVSKLNDFSFIELPVSYSGNYAMGLWIFLEDTNSVSDGLHVNWSKHLQISFKGNGDKVDIYCFPLGYYDDDIENKDFDGKVEKSKNKEKADFEDNFVFSGNWIWVMCSVSNYNEFFWINNKQTSLKREVLYNDVTSVYTLRYFMSGIGQTSTLRLENIVSNKKIYFRDILLFRDHIPYEYENKIKYYDLSKVEAEQFPFLLFAVNFEDFTISNLQLKYYTFSNKIKRFNTKKLTSYENNPTFELSANFVFQPLCAPLKENKFYQYNEEFHICETIAGCEIDNLNSDYCIQEGEPLNCKKGYYIYINGDSDNKMTQCVQTCPNGIRAPGTISNQGICNTELNKATCQNNNNFPINFKCNDDLIRINYNCIAKTEANYDNIKNSALFYSRCYQPPNIYVSISPQTKSKLISGYLLEVWFKLDLIQNNCLMTYDKEYYLYASPHSIYLDHTDENFYYQIINTIYYRPFTTINQNEWINVIVETKLGLSQSVTVYLNFKLNNPDITITAIPASINMELNAISFCSSEKNGDCTSAGKTSLNWGSAFYRNLRVWDLQSSSKEVIQHFVNKQFIHELKSLILFYPLTIDYMDLNELKEKMNKIDNIIATHVSTTNFESEDNYLFYNYATNFDPGVVDPNLLGVYFMDLKSFTYEKCNEACERCFSEAITSCYQCKEGYVLVDQTCTMHTGYYLRTPGTKEINLKTTKDNVFNIATEERKFAWTLTFWLKFFGVLNTSTEGQPPIISFSQETYIAYETSTTNLVMKNNNLVAFRDLKFNNYFGIWIQISLAHYRSGLPFNDIYPNMLTLMINKIDIPFYGDYSIPLDGIKPDYLTIGKDIVALFAEIKIYNHFIHGAFGAVKGGNGNPSLIFNLWNDNKGNCLTNEDLSSPNIVFECSPDYNIYLHKDKDNCDYSYQYFDVEETTLCGNCMDTCSEYGNHCFYKTAYSCTCDVTEPYYWLRKHRTTAETYCERIPYIDFGAIKETTIDNIPSSDTNEFTIEFWLFIYSYNTGVNNFHAVTIQWDKHNKVRVYVDNNSLYVQCFALYEKEKNWSYSQLIGLNFFQWNMIRCGTDLASEAKKYFLNTNEYDLFEPTPPTREETSSIVIIPETINISFGFAFIAELKFWKQYNFKYIDSSYIKITEKSKLPGLLLYYKNKFKVDNTTDPITYVMHNELDADDSNDIKAEIIDEFIGYNLIDPNNQGYYSNLQQCEEGKVFNSATLTCITPTATHCEFPGDINDNCVTCPKETKYIYPEDGSCVSDCPVRHYKNDLINQCRKCHSTCYTCLTFKEEECLSCTNDTYLYDEEYKTGIKQHPEIGPCVSNCESWGLTQSFKGNLCVNFSILVTLVNLTEPIDVNTFDNITCEVKCSALNPIYEWYFNRTGTLEANEPGMILDENATPFNDSDSIDKLTANLDHNFFEINRKYVLCIKVSSINIVEDEIGIVSDYECFTLTMNHNPVNGSLHIQPNVGLYNTTTFIIRAMGWEDDVDTGLLKYKFSSLEENMNNIIVLSDWTYDNEIFRNFTVINSQNASKNIKIILEIKDQWNAISSVEQTITIAKSLYGGVYSLSNLLETYEVPDITSAVLLARSEQLKSFSVDYYKSHTPETLQTQFEPTLDMSLIVMKEPQCTEDFCNGKGACELIDEFIACHCDDGYIGRNCHIKEDDGSGELKDKINELYTKVISVLKTSIDYEQFSSLHNLFFAGMMFIEDEVFFTDKIKTFFALAKSLFRESILNNTAEYFDIFDYYYSNEMMKLNKARLKIKMSANDGGNRNASIKENEEISKFLKSFDLFSSELNSFAQYLISLYGVTQKTFIYSSKNFYIVITPVNPTFSDTEFFQERKSLYRPYLSFMKCLTFIENEKLGNPYFQTWMIYIDYLIFPYGYNQTINANHTSPLVELRFIDAMTFKEVAISGCDGDNAIVISVPFTSYTWLSELNRQKWLYDPNNYKSPDDPIFKDPIYINESGYISNDTIEERIKDYNRLYNFSCMYYDEVYGDFNLTGVTYLNFTSDANYIQFNSTHLSRFATFFIENHMKFTVLGRFFYLGRPQVFKYWPNYSSNVAFIFIMTIFSFYIACVIIFSLYDWQYFKKEGLLEYIKREIVKVFLPYRSLKDEEIDKIIPDGFTPGVKAEIKFSDFLKENKALYNNDKYFHKHPIEISKIDITMNGGPKSSDILTINKNAEDFYHEDTIQEDSIENRQQKDFNVLQPTANGRGKIKNPFVVEKENNNNNQFNEDSNINPNNLPEKFEDEKLMREKQLEAFSNLQLSCGSFACHNLKERHILLSPIFNVSLFNARWKKMTMMITELNIEMTLISIFLTNDENATVTNFLTLAKIASFSFLLTNCVMFILPFFFGFSSKQRRRLYKLVITGGQLIVLKEWEEMGNENSKWNAIGFIICIVFWIANFYISISFVAVWFVQKKAWVFTFFITVVLDFVVCEILIEWFIGIWYSQRKSNGCCRSIGEMLNRFRNFRCLWP